MNMKEKANIVAGEPEDMKPGVFALSTMTAEDGSTVGLVDIVDVVGRCADENIKFADKVGELITAGCKKIRVRVNSPGGCVFTALSIYDTLMAARAKGVFVQSEVMGLAASAASFIILAADKVVISQNSQIMVHEPSTMLWGKLSELREGIELTEKVWRRMVDIYTGRTGQSAEEFEQAHTSDVFYTAEQAVAIGLADEVGTAIGDLPTESESKEEPQAASRSAFMAGMRRMAAKLGLMPEEKEPSAEEKLTDALDRNKQISAELEGMRAQLAAAIEERAQAQQERDAAQADRAADIERQVAARLAEIGQPGETLPKAQEKPVEVAKTAAELKADAEVLRWLAGGDVGSAVSYACQSAEHRAQVERLRRMKK